MVERGGGEAGGWGVFLQQMVWEGGKDERNVLYSHRRDEGD
jgi:hypothetical protein